MTFTFFMHLMTLSFFMHLMTLTFLIHLMTLTPWPSWYILFLDLLNKLVTLTFCHTTSYLTLVFLFISDFQKQQSFPWLMTFTIDIWP
jgi:hypothetical protein